MNNTPSSQNRFELILDELIKAISRNNNNSISSHYRAASYEINRSKEKKLHNAAELEYMEERLKEISRFMDAIHEGDHIVFDRAAHNDESAIRQALDVYNTILQRDKFHNRELTSILAKRIKKASKILSDLLSGISEITIYKQEKKPAPNKIQFTADAPLTPDYLITEIAPWIKAVVDLQNVFNDFSYRKDGETEKIRVLSITQRSPISLALSAGAEAIRAIEELVIPWRKRHAKTMAELDEQHRSLEIELKKAEVLEKRALADKTRNESHEVSEVTRRKKIENELLLESHCKPLALEISKKVLRLTDEKDVEIAVEKMLPSIVALTTSSLDINIKA